MSSLNMGSTTPEDFAREFLAAWNSRNPATMQAMYAPDGVLYDPWVPRGLSGGAIAAAAQRVFDRYSEISFTLISAIGTRDHVAFDWHLNALFASLGGSPKTIEVEGCDICRLRDGKIVELRGYFDRTPILDLMNSKAAA